MIRIALLFLVAIAVFAFLRMLVANRQLSNRQFSLLYIAVLAGMLLIYLGATGRLHWLFSILGVALPFAVRSLPMILRLFDMRRWFGKLRQAAAFGGAAPSPGQKSELNTRFFAMVLDHDTGEMDGRILAGPREGKHLSELDLAALLDLLSLARTDPDSENVLRAYLDRTQPDWQKQANAGKAPPTDDGNLSVKQAYEILGLEPDACVDEVRDAHRRLMQRVHPDRGGSDYLAARINEAKSVLLDHFGH